MQCPPLSPQPPPPPGGVGRGCGSGVFRPVLPPDRPPCLPCAAPGSSPPRGRAPPPRFPAGGGSSARRCPFCSSQLLPGAGGAACTHEASRSLAHFTSRSGMQPQGSCEPRHRRRPLGSSASERCYREAPVTAPEGQGRGRAPHAGFSHTLGFLQTAAQLRGVQGRASAPRMRRGGGENPLRRALVSPNAAVFIRAQ